MDRTERLSLVAGYQSAIDPLVDFVSSLSVAALDFRPALPGAWTIREHAVHLLDADTFGYARIRWAVTQPGVEVPVWDQELWQARAKYETADAMSSLETARALRRVVSAMARALVDADWETYTIRHPERGRLTLADVLKIYTDHAQAHLNYFRRNLDAFKAASTQA
jgi:DinB superfamily